VKVLLSYILLFISCSIVHAQQNDSIYRAYKKDSVQAKRAVKKAIYGNARKATIMSACFPGLGQIYNRKYWKAPVIYVALGGIGYWGITNQVKYKYYSNNLRAANDDDVNTINETLYSSDQLITQKKYYQKYRDISIMLGALVYLVNIIDANVDAHLRTFDVSDDLSLQLNPYSNLDYNNKLQAGLSLKLKFK
jgi:TM2 domain-containing membrane protein YozV